MLDIISKRILNILIKDDAIDEALIEAYDYGLKIMLINIWGVLISVFIGILLNEIFETIFFLILFILTRRYSGGYHADKLWKCSLMSSVTLFSVLLLHKNLNFSIITYISVFIASALIFIKFSPIENKNKPLENEIKLKCKKGSCLLLLIQFLFGIFLYIMNFEIYEIVFLTMMFISLFVVLAILKERRKPYEKNI